MGEGGLSRIRLSRGSGVESPFKQGNLLLMTVLIEFPLEGIMLKEIHTMRLPFEDPFIVDYRPLLGAVNEAQVPLETAKERETGNLQATNIHETKNRRVAPISRAASILQAGSQKE